MCSGLSSLQKLSVTGICTVNREVFEWIKSNRKYFKFNFFDKPLLNWQPLTTHINLQLLMVNAITSDETTVKFNATTVNFVRDCSEFDFVSPFYVDIKVFVVQMIKCRIFS